MVTPKLEGKMEMGTIKVVIPLDQLMHGVESIKTNHIVRYCKSHVHIVVVRVHEVASKVWCCGCAMRLVHMKHTP